MDGNVVANTIKFIEKIGNSSKIKHLELSFFGGEPLLYYTNTVCPIIDAARDVLQKNNKTYSIHFTSNGYLVNDTVISHLTELDDDVTFQITLDGHREKHNKVRFSASGKGSYDRIIDNIKKLLSNRINVGLRINYTQENIDSIKLILDDLVTIPQEHHKYFNVDFQRVWQEKNVENDDKTLNETIDAFRKVFKNISNYYSHVDAFRHPCYADMTNECVINYNGDVFKCTARDFVPEKRLGVLDDNGDIKWNDTNFVENRLNRKFNKNICKTCRIFPLCGGGCAQNASESPDNVCTKCNGELEKDKIILFRFYNSVVKNSNTTNDKQNRL